MSGISRRRFIVWSGTAAGAAVVTEALAPLVGARADEPIADVAPTPSYVTTVRRPQDQCVLYLQFYNVVPDFSVSPAVFTKVDSDKKNYLVVNFGPPTTFAPMHMNEQAYPLDTGKLAQYSEKKPVPPTVAVDPQPINAQIAGPSRIAFLIPDTVLGTSAAHPLVLDTTSLLNWVSFTLSVAANAAPPFQRFLGSQPPPAGLGPPVRPGPRQTAIEMPTGLIISPPAVPGVGIQGGILSATTIFVNAAEPVTHGAWTELWHTRLAELGPIQIGQFIVRGIIEDRRAARSIRALWAQDDRFQSDVKANISDPPDVSPFTTSLSYGDRLDIVRLSGDFTTSADKGGPYGRTGKGQNSFGFVPAPATVDLLMLTSLGGWLDCDAHWNLPKGNGTPSKAAQYYDSSLLQWRHRATQGRDSFVRVVRKGFLFPWGHRASLITITEREPTRVGNSGVGAYLRQKVFIVVGEPAKSYGGSGDFAPYSGRKLPFTTVQALTLITPDLEVPTTKYSDLQTNLSDVFVPSVGNKPYDFHFRGIDWAGDPVNFRSPVLWVDDTVAYADTTARANLIADVRNTWDNPAPTISLHNHRVSVAAPKDPDTRVGDTQIVASSFVLGAERPAQGSISTDWITAGQPAFYPTLVSVLVNMPEATSASGNPVPGSTMQFEHDHYLESGFTNTPGSANRGGIFLARVPTATRHAITFHGDKSGGAVTPNLGVDGISREIGPASAATAADLAALALGSFQPSSVFDSVNAKLLGGLELSAILRQVNFGDSDGSDDVNNDQVLTLTSLERESPHRVVTTLDWHPTIYTGGPQPGVDIFVVPDGSSADSMDLHAVIVTSLDPSLPSKTHIYGQIRDFSIHLFGDGATGFMVIPFDSLTFRSETGKKTDVDVQIGAGGVAFVGPLSFVQDLANALSFDGSGLVIDTSGDAITAELTLAIPSLGVGVFALQNLAFSAGVAIPYNGDPVRFDFAFCSRDNPFQLTIMMFTGGGFVGLGIGADGVELLEFSFDFGLGISIDIGIASGQISLVGGIYYECETLDDGGQDVQLTAYVKASGGLSALGIISVSVELYLTLGYADVDGATSLSGTATLTISVHILFFGGSVSVSVQKTFAGSPAHGNSAVHGAQQQHAVAGAGPSTGPPYPVNTFGSSMSAQDWATYCTSFALMNVGV